MGDRRSKTLRCRRQAARTAGRWRSGEARPRAGCRRCKARFRANLSGKRTEAMIPPRGDWVFLSLRARFISRREGRYETGSGGLRFGEAPFCFPRQKNGVFQTTKASPRRRRGKYKKNRNYFVAGISLPRRGREIPKKMDFCCVFSPFGGENTRLLNRYEKSILGNYFVAGISLPRRGREIPRKIDFCCVFSPLG